MRACPRFLLVILLAVPSFLLPVFHSARIFAQYGAFKVGYVLILDIESRVLDLEAWLQDPEVRAISSFEFSLTTLLSLFR